VVTLAIKSLIIFAVVSYLIETVLCVKVFVANPEKPRAIQEILLRNQARLVEFLSKFHTDRSDDEQFNDEKAYLIKQIKEMKPLEEAKPCAAVVGPATTEDEH
jgi:Mo25-like